MFKWFKNRTNKKEPDILIKRKYNEQGIEFFVFLENDNKKTKISFPISYSKYFDLKNLVKKDFYLSLQILENLWADGELKQTEDRAYFIENEQIYNFQEEMIDLLGFETDHELKVTINSELPVGSSNFSLSYDLYHSQYGYFSNFYDRCGIFYPVNNRKMMLLSKDLISLLKMVESPPDKREEQMEYVAKVKSLGKKIDVDFDDYFENEEYYFPEELDVDIEEESIDHLKVKPQFSDLNQNLNEEAKNTIEKDRKYGVKSDRGKKRRIFFDDNTKEDYQKVLNNSDINGADVPRFIENPATFLPESIDLKKFSERVKGLKERVYQAQPYVHGEDSPGMNWFDIDIGVNLKNIGDEDVSEEEETEGNDSKLELEEFEKLVEEARKNNEDYILWKNKWIKIPEDSEDFIKATKRAKDLIDKGKIDKNNIPYVFDIYENIDRLEYNLNLLNKKEKLKKAGALTYHHPDLFNGKLYSYQKEGFIWLNRLQLASLGGLLADDMGLGKTVQVIALMAQSKKNDKLKPSLIVAPASILENWAEEIRKFCPAINKIYIHRGSDRNKNSEIIKKSEIVITTYQTLVRDQVLLGEIDWYLLVCDETQNIKNKSTMAAHAVKAQKAELRLALTGTPIENSLSDLWSIMDYVQPGLLDSYKKFKKKFIKPIEKENENNIDKYEKKLITKIKPVYLRRTKEGELKEKLPAKYEKVQTINMSNKQEKQYHQIIINHKKSDGRTHLKALQQLICLCSHPGLVNKDWQEKSADKLIEEGPKLKSLKQILNKVRTKQEKAIIFTIYLKMQYMIQRVIREKYNLNYIPIINGQSRDRLKTVENFNNRDGFACMILSPRAAGTGLNITGANHVIHYTRWWNPAVEQQATDRVYRIGQDKDVYIYYPIVVSDRFETVEEKLNRLLKEKEKLAKNILIPNKKISDEVRRGLLEQFQ